MIKALVVEHINAARDLMVAALNSDPEILVIGSFDNANSAINFIKKSKPDIILMDMELSKPSGLEATRLIMESTPIPIIIISSGTFTNTFETLEAGAVAVSERPVSKTMKNFDKIIERLTRTAKLMSEIKVVKRIPSLKTGDKIRKKSDSKVAHIKNQIKIILIGASTGGPIVVEQILNGLPKSFAIPIIIVQHIATGFTDGMVKWLNTKSAVPVKVATNNIKLQTNQCYVAPEEYHIKVGSDSRIILSDELPQNNLKPSIDVLFKSAANIYGSSSVGILLTGMGKDGADGLKQMKDNGAITIAQDQNSSLIYGMPGEAAKIGAATYIFSPNEIIEFLIKISK